jgi:hypothetical protein
MLLANLAATLAFLPVFMAGSSAVEIAQNENDFSDWIYLYEDTFENSAGQEVTQQWWLAPDTSRQNNLMNFTLLARRSPVSANGTAAAVFDYVADCETMSYTIEQTEFLDSNDDTLDVQTFQRVMEAANPDDEIHGILDDLCSGVY